MDTEINSDAETIEKQKKIIEELQDEQSEDIVEADEAAGAAEGLSNASTDIHIDVAEDRDATPPSAIELSDEEIVS